MCWCGSCQQWHYLEMPLDRYVNILTAMINDGRFSHMGHAVLRLEGLTAWSVWLRINHWDSSQGRRARFRVGVLYHIGNRTLTFHGTASVVSQLLLLLFQDWTFATLASLPFVSQNNATTLPIHSPAGVAPASENAPLGVNCSVQSPPSASHSNASTTHSATQLLPPREAPPVGATSPPPPGPRSHRWQDCQELTSIVRRFVLQLEALQTEVRRMATATLHTPPPPSNPGPVRTHEVVVGPPLLTCARTDVCSATS